MITVDYVYVGAARDEDRSGHSLPEWHGCRIISHGEIFLMNADAPGSLDGRYFGTLPVSSIVGRAVPL
jgi:type IV secretory pathway protease TraF